MKKPSTPLPWSAGNGHFQHVSSQDIAYIIHAANAYPKLIAALISARNATDDTDEHAAIDALLGELGHIGDDGKFIW